MRGCILIAHWINRAAACSFALALIAGCASRPFTEAPLEKWTQTSFEDFSRGTLSDGGANTYVSADGSVTLVNRWDFNRDGHIDLVFANSHSQAEKLDAAIYWGDGKDFDVSRMSPIPNAGAQWTVAADLNADGKIDAILPNYTNGTWSKTDTYVYYGGIDDLKQRDVDSSRWGIFPFSEKVVLPTEAAQNAAVGDLNKDGYPDIVVAQSAGFWEYRNKETLASPSRIFWGSESGYALDNFLDLEAAGATDVAIADLDQDGWQDLVIANRQREEDFEIDSFVYFGGEQGFTSERRLELPTNQVNAVALDDVDGDGFIDILFANGQGSQSFIYLNKSGTFSVKNRIELPTSDARDVVVGDLNNDGANDVFFTNHQTAGNSATHSYLYWGSKDGFVPERRQEFETLGAWGASIADLNEDGLSEIIVSNYRRHNSFDVPSYIYWNSQEGLSDMRRTSVFTHGAIGNTVADFNGDGHLDVIFNNTIGGSRGNIGPLYVYWGNAEGQYSPDSRTELPSLEPYEWGAGDLNLDGWPDLVVANQAETGRNITENFIYWGSERGFSKDRRSGLVAHGAKGVSLADLDRNGYLDLIFTNNITDPGILIYWGEPEGYVTTDRTELPGGSTGAVSVADLNRDGNLDFVTHSSSESGSHIYWGNGTRNYSPSRRTEVPDSRGTSNSEIADLNRDGYLDLILLRRGDDPSYIYYGNADGTFSASRRSLFTPLQTQVVTVGDLDKDGWLDIVAPTYKNKGTRATMSKVFMGSAAGISDQFVLELPTNSGTGSQIADYNHDGYNDLLLINHRSEGDPDRVGDVSAHVTASYLYWGGPNGLEVDRKLLIPGRGAHYDSGVDLGNIYSRAYTFGYISVPHHYGDKTGQSIEWDAQTDDGSSVQLQVRTADTEDQLEKASWVGSEGENTYYEGGGGRLETPPGHTWIQYRAILSARQSDGAAAPVLEQVELGFR